MGRLLAVRNGIVGRGLGVGVASVPVKDGDNVGLSVPDEPGEQTSDLGHGERDQLLDWTASPLCPPASAVVTVRKACASIASVMCRYQLS